MRGTITWMLWVGLLLALAPGFAADFKERIAFQRNEPSAISVMFTDGSGLVDLPASRKCGGPYLTPALSPDKQTLLFSAKEGDQYKLFTWRLDERNSAVGEPQRLTPAATGYAEQFPAWSPDGTRVAFLATNQQKVTSLCVMNADGSHLVECTTVSYFATPAWSPDGKLILYSDLVAGKPTLCNISPSKGRGLAIRSENILAACYSPDGSQVAALVKRDGELADLYVLTTFGIGGRAIVKGLVGAKAVCWRPGVGIIFNAAKVGTQSGKAFWMVAPDGTGLQGVTGYAEPRQVAYFSVQAFDDTPYVPVAVDPVNPGIDPNNKRPTGSGTDEPDIAELLAAHAVYILSPANADVVQGMAPIKLIARKRVAKINILISGQFAYSVSTAGGKDPVVHVTYPWNTQELRAFDPTEGMPTSYQDALLTPDGDYTLCAQALDESDHLIDQHIIIVTVRNALPDDAIPVEAMSLRYDLPAGGPALYYRIHGEGQFTGTPPQQADALNAVLDAALRRSYWKPIPGSDRVAYHVDMGGQRNHAALLYGKYSANLPEFSGEGAYALNPLGEMVLASQGNDKAYLPLTQLSVPLPDGTVKLGAQWEKPMWVVADLLDREACSVDAAHTLDGFERVNGQRTVRIRSQYTLKSDLNLHTTPIPGIPGLKGERSATQGNAPDIGTLAARSAVGVRYAWFDLENHRLERVMDTILYALPAGNQPGQNPKQAGTLWYTVQYQYSRMPDPTKPDSPQ